MRNCREKWQEGMENMIQKVQERMMNVKGCRTKPQEGMEEVMQVVQEGTKNVESCRTKLQEGNKEVMKEVQNNIQATGKVQGCGGKRQMQCETEAFQHQLQGGNGDEVAGGEGERSNAGKGEGCTYHPLGGETDIVYIFGNKTLAEDQTEIDETLGSNTRNGFH